MGRHSNAFLAGSALLCITTCFSTAALAQSGGLTTSTTCNSSQKGTVGSFISDLYGGDGITLDTNTHEAHFCANVTSALANLGDLIGSSVTLFTSFSSADTNAIPGIERSLGPLAGERAVTIGEGNFHLGFGYAHATFKNLNGRSLSSQQLEFQHIDDGDNEFPDPSYENDLVRANLDIELSQDVYAFLATYGLTDRLDVSAVIPIVSVDASVDAVASIVDRSGAGVHVLGTESLRDSIARSASGIGDVVLRSKFIINNDGAIPFIGGGLNAALLAQVTLPTGDEDNLLGSGSTALKGALVFSSSLRRVNPIMNVGYEHFFNDAFDRSNLNYVAGFDFRASSSLTLAAEVVGRYELKNDQFTDPSFSLPDLSAAASDPSVFQAPLLDDEHRIDLSLGAKWVPFGAIPLRGNVTLPLNKNTGLRPDYVITLGIESSF